MDIDLSAATENAFIAYIPDTTIHGQIFTITPRRFTETKFKDDLINAYNLPAIVVKAIRDRQLTPKLATWIFNVEIMVNAQADDTDEPAWDALVGQMETVLLVQDLKTYLNSYETGMLCQGIVSVTTGDKVIEDRHWRQSFLAQIWASVQQT